MSNVNSIIILIKIVDTALASIVTCVGSYYFYLNRHHPVIFYRCSVVNVLAMFGLSMSHLFTLLLCVLVDNLQAAVGCVYGLVIFNSLAITCMTPIYIRHFYLLKVASLQQDMLQPGNVDNPEERNKILENIHKIKFYSTGRFAYLLFGVTNLIHTVIVCVGVAMSDKRDLVLFVAKPYGYTSNGAFFFHFLLSSVILLSYLPWAKQDGLYLKLQLFLRQLMLLIMVLLLSVSIVTSDPDVIAIYRECGQLVSSVLLYLEYGVPLFAIYLEKSRFYSEVSSLPTNNTIISTGSLPESVRKSSISSEKDISSDLSRQNTAKSIGKRHLISTREKSSKHHGDSLKIILANEQLRGEFIELLAREFALESWMFIEAVATYRREWTTDLSKDEVLKRCDEIKRVFLLPNSPNEVNVPIKIIKSCLDAIEALHNGNSLVTGSKHIFDNAANEILQMLSLNFAKEIKESLKIK